MLTVNFIMFSMITAFLIDIVIVVISFLTIVAVAVTVSTVVTIISMWLRKKQISSLIALPRSSWANVWNGDKILIIQTSRVGLESITKIISLMRKITESAKVVELSKGIGDPVLSVCHMALAIVVPISIEVISVRAVRRVHTIVIAGKTLLSLGGKNVQAHVVHTMTAASSAREATAPKS